MGFHISWIAFKGLKKAEALDIAGLRDTGTQDEANESPFSCAELPTGWTILFSNDFDYASPERAEAFAAKDAMLSCQIHEGIMYSGVRFHDHGHYIWSVSHFS